MKNSPLALPSHINERISDHPLSSLSASEIQLSAKYVKSLYPGKQNLQFKAVTLEEPPKAELIPYLKAERVKVRKTRIERKAFVSYYERNTVWPPLLFHSMTAS